MEEQNQIISSGIPGLDLCIGGWKPGSLYVVGGRPSAGKTTFGISCASAAVTSEIPTLYFCLERPEKGLRERYVGFSDNGLLYVNDRPSPQVTEMELAVCQMVKEKGVRLVIVDYLQLIHDPGKSFRSDEINSNLTHLKRIAETYKIPVIVLSQMSSYGDGRPQVSWLRESGKIAELADTVILMDRDCLYLEKAAEIRESAIIGWPLIHDRQVDEGIEEEFEV